MKRRKVARPIACHMEYVELHQSKPVLLIRQVYAYEVMNLLLRQKTEPVNL